jgi:D-hydroxyproline dehydrogenase subunit gamma
MAERIQIRNSKSEIRNNSKNSNDRNPIEIFINGNAFRVTAGATVAAALATAGINMFRRSVTGEARAPLCGMGICFECRVTINGEPHQRSCQIPCVPGMKVVTA